MFIELPMNCWIAIECSLNCHWMFIELHWIAELPLNDHWIAIECSWNCHWIAELPLNDHWIAIECSLNCHWIAELPLNCHWMFIELPLNCHWMIIELPLNVRGIAIELLNCHWMIIELALNVCWIACRYLCLSWSHPTPPSCAVSSTLYSLTDGTATFPSKMLSVVTSTEWVCRRSPTIMLKGTWGNIAWTWWACRNTKHS